MIEGAAGLAGSIVGMPQQAAADVNAAVHGNPRALLPTWTGGTPPTPAPAPHLPEPDIAVATNGPSLDDIIHPERWQLAAHYFANKLGLPQPSTPGERVSSTAVSALPAALLAPEAAPEEVAAEAPGLIGRTVQAARSYLPATVNDALDSAPAQVAKSAVSQTARVAVPTAASGAASQEAAEHGWTPAEQTAAGLAAGGLPSLLEGGAGLARSLTRGPGEARAAAMTQRLADANANNTPLTLGQATGNPLAKVTEATSRAVWGGGPLHAIAERQNVALGDRVNAIVDGLSGGGDVSPTGAGTAINKGVSGAKASMRTAERAAYNKVDELVPPATPIDVSGTLATLDKIAAPIPGAEATSAALTPKLVASIRDTMKTDAANGTMPYSALTALRTQVGNSIDWGFSPADPVANGALKQVYGALTSDLNKGAAAISPEAAQAVTDAKTLYAENQAQRDVLDGVVEKAGGPEAVYKAALSGTNIGATKIANVMRALDPDSRNLVRATVLNELGRAIPSEQTAAGTEFNASTFLTRWSKLSLQAKNALFGSSGIPGSLRADLDSLTETLSTLRKGGALKNPSGTGPLLGHIIGVGNFVSDILIGVWTGHPKALLGLAAPAVNNVLARGLVNPAVVRWLARTSRLPASAVPVALSQLTRMGQEGNQSAAALAALLNHANAQAGATPAAPAAPAAAPATGTRSVSKSGRPMVFQSGRWVYE